MTVCYRESARIIRSTFSPSWKNRHVLQSYVQIAKGWSPRRVPTPVLALRPVSGSISSSEKVYQGTTSIDHERIGWMMSNNNKYVYMCVLCDEVPFACASRAYLLYIKTTKRLSWIANLPLKYAIRIFRRHVRIVEKKRID